MPIPSKFGADYSRYFVPVPGEQVPFPNPANDGQKIINARARAERAGDPIGSGQLRMDGTLVDPDRGFMRFIGEHPYVGAAIALGPAAPFAFGGGGGSAGGTSSIIPGTGIPTVAGTGAGVTAPTAVAAGAGAAGAGAAGAGAASATKSIVDRIKASLTDPSAYASLAPLIAGLATRGGGSGAAGAGMDELRRIQAITEARMRRVDPLHQVATQLAFQRAPIRARQGIDLTNVTLPE